MSRTVGPPKPRKSNEVVDTVITYFKHWLDNKGRTNRKLAVFIDGSAVRGCYHGNDCGLSLAITAYKVALEHQILSPQDRPEVNMVFTDCDAQNLHNLFYFLRQVRKEFSSVFNYVKFMIIYADFERTLNWILSDEFTFCESSTFVFEPPSSSHERFITHSTPLFVYTDSCGLPDGKLPLALRQKILDASPGSNILISWLGMTANETVTLENIEWKPEWEQVDAKEGNQAIRHNLRVFYEGHFQKAVKFDGSA